MIIKTLVKLENWGKRIVYIFMSQGQSVYIYIYISPFWVPCGYLDS